MASLSAIDENLIKNADLGNHQEVRKMLRAGANVNAQLTAQGTTALWIASQNGHVEVVQALLQHDNVDVNLQDSDGDDSPLQGESKWPCGSRPSVDPARQGGCESTRS
jgi:ankyrin repeat protein